MLPLVGRYNCSPYPEIQLCWAWRGWDVSNFLLATRPDRCTYRPVGIPTLMVIFLHAACVVPAVERCWRRVSRPLSFQICSAGARRDRATEPPPGISTLLVPKSGRSLARSLAGRSLAQQNSHAQNHGTMARSATKFRPPATLTACKRKAFCLRCLFIGICANNVR